MNKNISSFINKHKDMINNNDWEMLYVSANNILSAPDIGELTTILLASDINPLNFLDSIPEAYLAYTNISKFDIPKNIKKIDDSAFDSCEYLTNITIPDSVTSIGDNAFYNCSSLTSIIIPNSVKSIGDNTFYKCYHLKNIYFNGYVDQWADLESKRQESYGPTYTVHCIDGDYIKEGD